MLLFLLRHGAALSQAPSDSERPLSITGHEQATEAALSLRSHGWIPDVIVSSPYLRARDTAGCVMKEFGLAGVQLSEHLVPGSDQRNILKELNSADGNAVLLVGHEPHISAFLSLLITGSRNLQIAVPTGTLAVIEIERPMVVGKGYLRALVPPGQM